MQKLNKNQPNFSNKKKLDKSRKEYKKIVKYFKSKYNKQQIKKFSKLKKSDPKAFWKLLKDNQRESSRLDLNDFFVHFESLNKNSETGRTEINTLKTVIRMFLMQIFKTSLISLSNKLRSAKPFRCYLIINVQE
jgi:hypothetical protein